MPSLFHLFFLSDFKLEDFSMKNESFIREEAIKHFYTNMTRENKLYYINQLREDLVLLKTLICIIKRINSKLSNY
jgi:hypothetical protein